MAIVDQGSFALTSDLPEGRQDLDFYPTPAWATEALCDYLGANLPGGILDPGCGDGAILDVMAARNRDTVGIELDPGRAAQARAKRHQVTVGDALTEEWPSAGGVIMNPPYLLATAFIRKALAYRERLVGLGRQPPAIWALLRISYIEPTDGPPKAPLEGRRDLLTIHKPTVLVLPRRPKFVNNKSDSTTSAWFGFPGNGQVRWLP